MNQILEMKHIYKDFGAVKVLNDIDFSLGKGEVRALLGANGAGKSTLIKILGGVHAPTKGEIYLRGNKINFKDSYHSKQSGISVIYQELSLVPTLSVIDNIFLGREVVSGVFLKKEEMKKEYEDICRRFSFDIPANAIVSKLSIAKQQMVEIMKAVSCDTEIIIMDEPTTSLTNNEKASLFGIIAKLKAAGKSIIYISHILDEIFLNCDSASIMRNGIMVGSYDVKNLTKEKITQLMTGIDSSNIAGKKQTFHADYTSEPVLEVRNLGRGDVIKDVSFKVHKGEVVGIAGLVGSKRTEIINLIYGVDHCDRGEILRNGTVVKIRSPKQAIHHKIGFIPEDRKHLGLILGQEIYKNSTAVQVEKFKTSGFLNKGKEIEFAEFAVKKLGIKISNVKQKVKELSGGNQQKVVVSKWLNQDMDLIIYDEPTKGIDIAAKEDIFHTIEEFSGQGIGVIFISSDLEEVIRVADRVLVVRDGTIVSELNNDNLTVQEIMDKIFDV
ncbi:MAG TPA: sugar ABC transporter ATP-binding protein [Lachnoclostridium sp.]|jgi:ribose transport system ATP-binding protein|uniref:sugar ABC transporter ATP-binding protein n=1 Tax=Lacrimispora sp. TaxID=2719234 RepID=UPI000EC52C04|nr:sugar ABC transporter ATP-binding protein [Lacrimispora sp.]HCD45983.1 sugar ABC transporter ATP-binding protein [Lachnoclostridium sp.]